MKKLNVGCRVFVILSNIFSVAILGSHLAEIDANGITRRSSGHDPRYEEEGLLV